ncbi:uncharacterized protein KQ657_003225 [Scheffersomyces spartinae]|uniref:Globin domain-containing protein n=1 Tax=Scheffersomyces spartinae TaxID=45513 RepID=A0A9P7VCA0_9ASCO|nr:uncharacterized protein KQ657_003225 [Scheffersomyces spartinae]KAG7195463.1 hypothetical protein KQ657_003225 [Scheffersomyces spartinae]
MSARTTYILDFQDVRKIRQTWTNIQNNNKYHKDLFVARAYANLIAGSPFLKYIFTSDAMMREHSMLFGEMLSSVVTYLHSPIMVNEYLIQFISKNDDFISNMVKYLEPMGVALTQTIKQWIGNIDSELECAWVQLYLYIAVFITDNTHYPEADLSSETQSVLGEELSASSPSGASFSPSPSSSENETEDVQPLNIKRLNTWSSSPPSVISSGTSSSDGSGILHIDLRKNDKYKGFRRDSNTSLFEVKIPTSSTTFEKPTKPADLNGMLSPRASSPSNASFASFGTAISSVGHIPFDPRGHKKHHSRQTSMTESFTSGMETDVPERRRPFMSSDQFTDYDVNYGTAVEDLEDYMSSNFANGSSNSDNDRNERSSTMNTLSSESSGATPKFKFKKPATVITNDDDLEFIDKEPRGFGFDPRLRGHRRTNSISGSSDESPSPTSSQWRIVDDEEDPYAGEISSARIASRLPPRLLDHSSFGLKGLSVIQETENDDDVASSRYEEEEVCTRSSNYSGDVSGTASSHEEESSEASTLSLHNSDYSLAMEVNNLSSAGSRKQPSPVLESAPLGSLTAPAKMSSIHSSTSGADTISGSPSTHTVATAMSQGVYRNKLASSSSLIVGTNGGSNQKRVSLGFMRSSYVLKKEMESQHGSSVGSSPQTNPFHSPDRSVSLTLHARSSIDLTENMSRSRSIGSSHPKRSNHNESSLLDKHSPTQSLINLDPRKGGFAPCGINNKYAKNSVQKSMGCVPITEEVGFKEKGLKAAFIALFSGGSNKSHLKAPKSSHHKSPMLDQSIKTIKQNIEYNNKTMEKQKKTSEKPLPPNPSGKLYKLSTSSIYSFKKYAESSTSVNSNDSSVSGFSFFNKKKNEQYVTAARYTKRNPKKNKYMVTSTPYSIL